MTSADAKEVAPIPARTRLAYAIGTAIACCACGFIAAASLADLAIYGGGVGFVLGWSLGPILPRAIRDWYSEYWLRS